MSETCISVRFEDGTEWPFCWGDATPYPGWDDEQVYTGLRRTVGGGATAWRTCQYYLNGLPSPCAHWTEGALSDPEGTVSSGSYYCSYVKNNTSDNPLDPAPETPTGYNAGQCDFLGRRNWCTQYTATADIDPNEWTCAAPNPYLTGVGERDYAGQMVTLTPVPRDRIWGFNDDGLGRGVGLCDCHGMGRGQPGCDKNPFIGDAETDSHIQRELSKLPIMCNFYRPFRMGFGIIDPHTKESDDVEPDGITITEKGWQKAAEPIDYRLPLNYKIFNIQAKLQTCQWWEADSSLEFYVDNQGFINLEGENDNFQDETEPFPGRIYHCACEDDAVNDYRTRVFETATASGGIWHETGAQFALDAVWAVGGGAVCNGARAECPFYSGKWTYLTTERMLPGMPITAPQLLEMRFWTHDWETQKQYNDYYRRRPNFDDVNREWIYIFTKWNKLGADVEDSIMEGARFTLCQPAPLFNKEFSPLYINREGPLNYPPILTDTGTDAPKQVQYPDLVRDPEDEFADYAQLVVTYPYVHDNVWDPEICVVRDSDYDGHIKRHNDIYGDAIACLGQTQKEKNVYIINTRFVDGLSDYGVHSSTFSMTQQVKYQFYKDVSVAIFQALEDGKTDYVKFTTSDEFGYFQIEPVKLQYNVTNPLLVCVDLEDGTWEFRWRVVKSRWCGGAITQTEFIHTYPEDTETGGRNSQPEYFDPSASCQFVMTPLGDSVSATELSTYSFENVVTNVRSYSYYKYRMWPYSEAILINKWGAVGNTNKVMVEIDDINLNYIYDWDITSATMEQIPDEDSELPNEELPTSVPLQKVNIDSDSIPPNACVLEPIDDVRIRFLPSEWELRVYYYHEGISNNSQGPGEEGSTFGALSGAWVGSNVLVDAPYTIGVDTNVISITNITIGPVAVMANFHDVNGRIISTMATRAMVGIVSERCRPVEIEYRYAAEGKQFQLMPATGLCIDIKKDMPMSEPYKHVELPNCGDHDHNWSKWQGPMWYPYDSCRGYDMYDEFTVCNNCQAGYVGPDNDGVLRDDEGNALYAGGGQVLRRKDYRYCGPYKYDAFGTTRGNWAATCDCGCRFWYSDASNATVVFTGHGRKRAAVYLPDYYLNDWHLPPFGNDGREIVEKYLSQDYIHHFFMTSTENAVEWMPIVMDNSSFFMSFDATGDNPEDTSYALAGGLDDFRIVHQLSLVTLGTIGETIVQEEDELGFPTGTSKRYRWDELFTIHHEGNCSHPLPVYTAGSTTKVIFYYFKKVDDKDLAWAWQERWQDTERSLEMEDEEYPPAPEDEIPGDILVVLTGRLDFLEIEIPKYVFDYHKEEHRFLPDEGEYIIQFVAPVFNDAGTELDEHPKIGIAPVGADPEDIKWRWFETNYSTYGNQQITWVDEGGQAKVDASSDEDNPYEEAMGSEWMHDNNILFDTGPATTIEAAEAAGRKVATGADIFGTVEYKYFNRGIIANITRDRLDYLPKQDYEYTFKYIEGASVFNLTSFAEGNVPSVMLANCPTADGAWFEINPYWKHTLEIEIPIEMIDDVPLTWSFSRVTVKGLWGTFSDENTVLKASMPAVSITAQYEDGSIAVPRAVTSLPTESVTPEDGEIGDLNEYEFDFRFLLGPQEMIHNRMVSLTIRFTLTSADECILLNDLKVYHNLYANKAYEKVKLWERKYVASYFTIGADYTNLDGPEDNLHYHPDLTRAGLYFNFRGSTHADQVIQDAADKMRSVNCGIYYTQNEDLPPISYSTLHEVERNAQQELYKYAHDLDTLGDYWSWAKVTPYKIATFMDEIGVTWAVTPMGIFASAKLRWELHYLVKLFEQYDFWRPGGHYYTWSDYGITQNCTYPNPTIEDVFEGRYIHVDHQGIGTPVGSPEAPVDPATSLKSLRIYVQEAKYDRAVILAGGEPHFRSRPVANVPFNTFI